VHRFYIDENLAPDLSGALGSVFTRDRFRSAKIENLLNEQDLPLFLELQSRKFDAIITLDLKQVDNVKERAGLRRAQLHWVGLEQEESGEAVVASLASKAFMGVARLSELWPDEPHMFQVGKSTKDPVRFERL
jgi:hypothetical protein